MIATLSVSFTPRKAEAQFDDFQDLVIVLTALSLSQVLLINLISGFPSGNYVAQLEASGSGSEGVKINGGGSTGTRAFTQNDSSLSFDVAIALETICALAAIQTLSIILSPGNAAATQAGFATRNTTLTLDPKDNAVACQGDDDDDDTTVEENTIDDIESIENEGFDPVELQQIANDDGTVMKANSVVKIPSFLLKGSIKSKVDSKDPLSEDEIKDKLGLKDYKFKLNKLLLVKNLFKNQVIKQKKKEGKTKAEAKTEAAEDPLVKILEEIILKVENTKKGKLRKAKKKSVIKAISVSEINSSGDPFMKGDTRAVVDGSTCFRFKVCFNLQLCPRAKKALVRALQRFDLSGVILPGESVTADFPVKFSGPFKKFFGEENKKGKTNGKTDIPFTLLNSELTE